MLRCTLRWNISEFASDTINLYFCLRKDEDGCLVEEHPTGTKSTVYICFEQLEVRSALGRVTDIDCLLITLFGSGLNPWWASRNF